MKSEIKYIDELSKNALKDYATESDVTWNEFHQRNFESLKPKSNFILNNGVKKVSITVVSLSIATAGILLYSNTYIDKININYGHIKNKVYSNDTLNTKLLYVVDDTKDAEIKKDIIKEDVVIKIEVPVHKKVEIRKQIIVNDNINK